MFCYQNQLTGISGKNVHTFIEGLKIFIEGLKTEALSHCSHMNSVTSGQNVQKQLS